MGWYDNPEPLPRFAGPPLKDIAVKLVEPLPRFAGPPLRGIAVKLAEPLPRFAGPPLKGEEKKARLAAGFVKKLIM